MPLLKVEDLLAVLALGSGQRVTKPWGYEVIITTTEFLLKFIEVFEGHRTSQQFHRKKVETLIHIGGAGRIVVDGVEQEFLKPILIKPNTVHRTSGPVQLLEITTLDNDDVVRLADDYGR